VLGEELRKSRLAAGLSQEEVAKRSGFTREYISHLERNVGSPTLDAFVRICQAIGLKAWTMLRRVEPMMPVRSASRR